MRKRVLLKKTTVLDFTRLSHQSCVAGPFILNLASDFKHTGTTPHSNDELETCDLLGLTWLTCVRASARSFWLIPQRLATLS